MAAIALNNRNEEATRKRYAIAGHNPAPSLKVISETGCCRMSACPAWKNSDVVHNAET